MSAATQGRVVHGWNFNLGWTIPLSQSKSEFSARTLTLVTLRRCLKTRLNYSDGLSHISALGSLIELFSHLGRQQLLEQTHTCSLPPNLICRHGFSSLVKLSFISRRRFCTCSARKTWQAVVLRTAWYLVVSAMRGSFCAGGVRTFDLFGVTAPTVACPALLCHCVAFCRRGYTISLYFIKASDSNGPPFSD